MRGVHIICLAAAFSCGGAFAQTATPVQSGEHETFSRLVFAAPSDLDWRLVGDDTTTPKITFSDRSLELDTSRVFELIPRDRIASVEADDQGLTLSLGCDCTVDVSQIASGHIVIDVADPPEDLAITEPPLPEPVPASTVSAADLPLQLPPLSFLATDLDLPLDEPDPAARVGPLHAAAIRAALTPDQIRPQVTIREHARAGLLPPAADGEGSTLTRLPACDIEELAHDIMMTPPGSGLTDIASLRAGVVNDLEEPSAQGLTRLARAYLEAGWGAEAAQAIAASGESTNAPMARIAKAMDGDPNLTNQSFEADPACGPATTTLLLLSGQFIGDWGSVDEEAFVRFVDRLPSDRRADLRPRLREGLARLGHEEVLERLAAIRPARLPYAPPSPEITAAGTDTAAVRATMQLMESQAPKDTASASIHLQNALALRASIPDGPLSEEFDTVLARRLLMSGYVTDAIEVVEVRPDLAPELLALAIRELPKEKVIEIGVRLRPYLRSDLPEIMEVAELMQDFGLRATARDFIAVRPGEGLAAQPLPPVERRPRLADETIGTALSADDRAWLSRDFALVSQNEASPRQPLANEVQRRNSATPPSDDFDQAQIALEDSRRLATAIGRLLDGTD